MSFSLTDKNIYLFFLKLTLNDMLFQYVNIDSNNVVFFKFVENLLKATSKEMLEFINLKKVIKFLVN